MGLNKHERRKKFKAQLQSVLKKEIVRCQSVMSYELFNVRVKETSVNSRRCGNR